MSRQALGKGDRSVVAVGGVAEEEVDTGRKWAEQGTPSFATEADASDSQRLAVETRMVDS